MAKKQALSPQPVPSTEAEDRNRPVESIELTMAEIANRAATTTTVLQEIIARGDGYYANHWGINE